MEVYISNYTQKKEVHAKVNERPDQKWKQSVLQVLQEFVILLLTLEISSPVMLVPLVFCLRKKHVVGNTKYFALRIKLLHVFFPFLNMWAYLLQKITWSSTDLGWDYSMHWVRWVRLSGNDFFPAPLQSSITKEGKWKSLSYKLQRHYLRPNFLWNKSPVTWNTNTKQSPWLYVVNCSVTMVVT